MKSRSFQPAANRWRIGEAGRLWGQALHGSESRRLDGPVAGGARVEWEAAVSAAADALKGAVRLRVLASPRATVEEIWALAKLAEGPLGGAPVHLPLHEDGADDRLLIRADRTPNRRGAQAVLEALCGGARPVAELEQALAAGEVDALLALGPGLVGPVESEPPAVEPHLLARAKERVVIDAYPSALSGSATVLLPATCFGESRGTYVNFAGRVQHVERCLSPKVDCRPAAMILGDLSAALGAGELPPPERTREQVSREVAAFGAIRWDELPASAGQDLPGADPAREACPATGALVKMLAAGMTAAGGK